MSEEVIEKKWDYCFTNLLKKSGIGLGVGVVLSVFLFKKRVSPIAFATGVGTGIAYSECQFEFTSQEVIYAKKVVSQ